MIFYLSGHDRLNPILQLLICLYPEEEHRQGRLSDAPEGEYVVSCLSHRQGRLYAEAYGYWGDRVSLICPENMNATEHAVGEWLRRALYLLLVKRLEEAPQWGMLTGVKPAKLALNMLNSGLSPQEVDICLREQYFVSQRRSDLAVKAALISQKCRDDTGEKDIDLYIGIPFCPAKCAYCSFVSNDVRKWGHMVAPYLDTLIYEIEAMGRVLADQGRNIRSIYIGGGTPTILDERQLDRLLLAVRQGFELKNLSEFTLEGGRPETITQGKLKLAHEYGVDRISINPQTMNQKVLQAVGRLHTAQDIADCYYMARNTADFQINMDLIAGLPSDDNDSLIDSVARVIEFAPDNITLHSMARKKGAPLRFGKNGDLSWRTLDRCHDMIYSAGYQPYYMYRQKYSAGGLENVGFMRDGSLCRYNVIMMEETGHVAALGSGGVTKLAYGDGSIQRISNPKYPIDYIGRRDKIDDALGKLSKALEKD